MPAPITTPEPSRLPGVYAKSPEKETSAAKGSFEVLGVPEGLPRCAILCIFLWCDVGSSRQGFDGDEVPCKLGPKAREPPR